LFGPSTKTRTQTPEGYEDFLQNLKRRIRAAQVKAVFAVNREFLFSTGTLAAKSWNASV
jgi:hypothetical protein